MWMAACLTKSEEENKSGGIILHYTSLFQISVELKLSACFQSRVEFMFVLIECHICNVHSPFRQLEDRLTIDFGSFRATKHNSADDTLKFFHGAIPFTFVIIAGSCQWFQDLISENRPIIKRSNLAESNERIQLCHVVHHRRASHTPSIIGIQKVSCFCRLCILVFDVLSLINNYSIPSATTADQAHLLFRCWTYIRIIGHHCVPVLLPLELGCERTKCSKHYVELAEMIEAFFGSSMMFVNCKG